MLLINNLTGFGARVSQLQSAIREIYEHLTQRAELVMKIHRLLRREGDLSAIGPRDFNAPLLVADYRFLHVYILPNLARISPSM